MKTKSSSTGNRLSVLLFLQNEAIEGIVSL